MTQDEKIKLLAEWSLILQEQTDLYHDISKLFGSNPDCKVFETIFRCAEAYTKALAVLVGDNDGWLFYYWHECDLGNSPGQVIIDGEAFALQNIPALVRAIG